MSQLSIQLYLAIDWVDNTKGGLGELRTVTSWKAPTEGRSRLQLNAHTNSRLWRGVAAHADILQHQWLQLTGAATSLTTPCPSVVLGCPPLAPAPRMSSRTLRHAHGASVALCKPQQAQHYLMLDTPALDTLTNGFTKRRARAHQPGAGAHRTAQETPQKGVRPAHAQTQISAQ